MPVAVRLYRAARNCFGSLGKGKAARLVLSLSFKAVLGIQRVFHFETLDDRGFAVLTGGNKVLGRKTLGGLVRAAPVRGVLRFVRQTAPRVKQAVSHTVSLDEPLATLLSSATPWARVTLNQRAQHSSS